MGRYSRLREIRRMDPARDYAEILRLISQYEFPWDYRQGVSVAFLRDYGVPRISVLLDRTQEFERHGQKRYDDTVLIGYEMAVDGFDSERGRAAARHLNRIHGKYRIANDDFRYVLATTVVGPKRWIDRYGWRPLCAQEVRALAEAARKTGAMMGIADVPDTYEGFERLLDAYEERMFAYDPANRRVASATFRVMASWYPRPLRPFRRPVRAGPARRAAAEGPGLPAAAPVGADLGVGGAAAAGAVRARDAGQAPPPPGPAAAAFVPLRLAAGRPRAALGAQPAAGTAAGRGGRRSGDPARLRRTVRQRRYGPSAPGPPRCGGGRGRRRRGTRCGRRRLGSWLP